MALTVGMRKLERFGRYSATMRLSARNVTNKGMTKSSQMAKRHMVTSTELISPCLVGDDAIFTARVSGRGHLLRLMEPGPDFFRVPTVAVVRKEVM